MKRKFLERRTCFLMGTCGALCYFAAGALLLAGAGLLSYLLLAGFALEGGMLLFLALAEKGGDGLPKRKRLMLIFFSLLASIILPAAVAPLFAALIMPAAAHLYMDKKKDAPLWLCLLAAEAAYAAFCVAAVLRGENGLPPVVMGLALLFVGAARAWMMLMLYKRAGKA